MLASRSSSLNIPPAAVCDPVLRIPYRFHSLVLVLFVLALLQRPALAVQNVTFQDTSSFLQYIPEVCDGTTTTTGTAQGGGILQSCIGAWTTIDLAGASNGTVTTTSGPSAAFGLILPQLFFTFRGLAVYVKTSPLSNATANLTVVSQPSGAVQSHVFNPSSNFWAFTSLDANQTSTLSLTFGAEQNSSSSGDGVRLDIDFVKIIVEDASQSSSFLPSQTSQSGSQPSAPQTSTISITASPSASLTTPVISTTRTSRTGAIIAASVAGAALFLGIFIGILFWRYRVRMIRRRAVERVERMQERQSRIAVRMLGDDGDGRGPYSDNALSPGTLESGPLADPTSSRVLSATYGPRHPSDHYEGPSGEGYSHPEGSGNVYGILGSEDPGQMRTKRFSHGVSTINTTAAEADEMSESRSNMAAISHGTGTDWDHNHSDSQAPASDTQSQLQNIDSELSTPISPLPTAPDASAAQMSGDKSRRAPMSMSVPDGVATDEKTRAHERGWYSSPAGSGLNTSRLSTTPGAVSTTNGRSSAAMMTMNRNSNASGRFGFGANGPPKLTLNLPGSISISPSVAGTFGRDTDTEAETEDGKSYWRAI